MQLANQNKIALFQTKTHCVDKIILANEIAFQYGTPESERQKWLDIITENVLIIAKNERYLRRKITASKTLHECIKRTLKSTPHDHPEYISLYHCALVLGNVGMLPPHKNSLDFDIIRYFLVAKEIADKNAIALTPGMKKFFMACVGLQHRVTVATHEYKSIIHYSHLDFILLFEAAANDQCEEAISYLKYLKQHNLYPVKVMATAVLASLSPARDSDLNELDTTFLQGISAFYGWKRPVDFKQAKEIFDFVISNFQTVNEKAAAYATLYSGMVQYQELSYLISDKTDELSTHKKQTAIVERVSGIVNTLSLLKNSKYFRGNHSSLQPIYLIRDTLNLLKVKNCLDSDSEIILRECLADFYSHHIKVMDNADLILASENINLLNQLRYIVGDKYSAIFKRIAKQSLIFSQKTYALLQAIKFGDAKSVSGIFYFATGEESLNEICSSLLVTLNNHLYLKDSDMIEALVNSYLIYDEHCSKHNKPLPKDVVKPLHDAVLSAKQLIDAGKSDSDLLNLASKRNLPALVKLASNYRESNDIGRALFFSAWALLELEPLLLSYRSSGQQYNPELVNLSDAAMKFISGIANSSQASHKHVAVWYLGLIAFVMPLIKLDSSSIQNIIICNVYHSFYSKDFADVIDMMIEHNKDYSLDRKYIYAHPIEDAQSLPGRDKEIEMTHITGDTANLSRSYFSLLGRPVINMPVSEANNDRITTQTTNLIR